MHALSNEKLFPRAAETVFKSTYMDDSMDSILNEQPGLELYQQLSELWGAAGMHARKWLSNSPAILEGVPAYDIVSEVDLDQGTLPAVKPLGVLWIAKDDVFSFRANPPDKSFELTKRHFLTKIAMMFDPMGFLAPFTISVKLLLQEMWMTGLSWDDPMDEELISKARK